MVQGHGKKCNGHHHLCTGSVCYAPLVQFKSSGCLYTRKVRTCREYNFINETGLFPNKAYPSYRKSTVTKVIVWKPIEPFFHNAHNMQQLLGAAYIARVLRICFSCLRLHSSAHGKI